MGGFNGILELCGVTLAKPATTGGGGGAGTETAFPLAGRGSVTLSGGLSAVAGLDTAAVQYQGRPQSIEIAGDSDERQRYTRGLPSADMSLSGYVMGASGFVGFGQRSTLTLGTVLVRPDRWTLTKTWPLLQISGDANTRHKWTWGTPTYALSFQGTPTIVAGVGGPLVDTETLTASIAADSIGTIAFAAAHADYWRHVTPLRDGGRPYCWFSGRLSGGAGEVAYTAGTSPNDFAWLFTTPAAGVCDAPVRGTYAIDTNGQVLQGTGILYSVSLFFNASLGGALSFSAAIRQDQP
jgi:hypothetical protein